MNTSKLSKNSALVNKLSNLCTQQQTVHMHRNKTYACTETVCIQCSIYIWILKLRVKATKRRKDEPYFLRHGLKTRYTGRCPPTAVDRWQSFAQRHYQIHAHMYIPTHMPCSVLHVHTYICSVLCTYTCTWIQQVLISKSIFAHTNNP